MKVVIVLINYFVWHYTKAIGSIFRLYKNFFVFLLNFFSLPILFKTWLSPWRRLSEQYPTNALDFQALFEAFTVNILMRIVGFIMRAIIIGSGVISLFILTSLLPMILVIWLIMPLLIVFLFLLGVGLLFK